MESFITINIISAGGVNITTVRHIAESIVRTLHHVDDVTYIRDDAPDRAFMDPDHTLIFKVHARDTRDLERTARVLDGALDPLVAYVFVEPY